jgi:hypothetical protein
MMFVMSKIKSSCSIGARPKIGRDSVPLCTGCDSDPW